MRKSNILIFILIGLMILTSCKSNEQDTRVETEQVAKIMETEIGNVTEDEIIIIEHETEVAEALNTVTIKKKTDITVAKKELADVSDYNFSVFTVGTGTPKFSESQSSASTLIQYNGGYYLVDFGDGSYKNLEVSDFDFKNLKAMLFTHHHMDHTTDFFDIYIKSFLANDDEIDIIGPPRTQMFIDFFEDVYLDDLLYRKTNIKAVDETYKDIILNYGNTSEVIDSGSFNIDGLDIQVAEMYHTMYNLSYRFEADHQSIVVTGDVNYDEKLIDFAKDADILVIDGTLYKENKNSNEISRKYIEPFYEYGGDFEVSPHLTFEEMVEIAVKSNVSTLVITHYNEADQDRIDKSISKIKESFDGEVIYATDMLEIGVSSGEEKSVNAEEKEVANENNLVETGELTDSYNIVDTNQTDFYSNKDIITPPSEGQLYYGQDASYVGNLPSYTNNNDGTISDNVTELMWSKDMGNKMTYEEAGEFASSSNLGGYDDWRIPTIKELYSLIQFDGRVLGETATDELFIDTDYFNQPLGDTSIGEREIDAQTWSSTKYVGTTMTGDTTIFGVNFVDGRIKGYAEYKKRTKTNNTMYFRLVRGNTSYGENNFVDHGDGTITDLATGFMWQQVDSGYGMDWEDALNYSENLEYSGYDDWRLPNAKELQSIVDYNRSLQTTNSAAINELFYTTSILDIDGDVNYPYFWSSTSHLDGKNPYAYGVYIAFGEAFGIMNDTLLDVHGAGAQRSDPKSGDESDYPLSFGPQGDIRTVYNYVRCVRNN